MERKVIKIAARPLLTANTAEHFLKRRVAAYARVSTSSEEQLVSFEAQKDYYEKYIHAHPNWDFAGLYVDEGISGVSCKNRAGFNSMIKDAVKPPIIRVYVPKSPDYIEFQYSAVDYAFP